MVRVSPNWGVKPVCPVVSPFYGVKLLVVCLPLLLVDSACAATCRARVTVIEFPSKSNPNGLYVNDMFILYNIFASIKSWGLKLKYV